MLKERKYKRWKASRRKYSQTHKEDYNVFLILGLLSITASIAIRNNPQLVTDSFFRSSYFSYRSSNYKSNQEVLKINKNNQSEQPVIVGSTNDFKSTNFNKIDYYASSVRYDGTSVFELASLLSSYANTEAEKARIIYSWIAYNITYDVPALLSGNYGDLSPQGVLKTRKGVCSGYAKLYEALARAMKLNVAVVEGYGKGYGYVIGNTTKINHAWNAVKIENKWYLLDTTWGAGSLNGGEFNRHFNPYYFATPPGQFILDHFPIEDKWQLLTKHYSKAQFDTTPKFYPEFFKDSIHLVTHYDQTIRADGRFQVIFSAPENTDLASQLLPISNSLNDGYSFVQKKDNKIIVNVAPPVGNFELNIFSKNKHSLKEYQQAITYKVVSQNVGEEFPKTYSTFSEKNSYLYSPLNKYLPAARSIYFKIEVPNALEVQIINTSSNTWTKLTRSASIFTGKVPVSSGKIQVSAKFPGQTDYLALVEYN